MLKSPSTLPLPRSRRRGQHLPARDIGLNKYADLKLAPSGASINQADRPNRGVAQNLHAQTYRPEQLAGPCIVIWRCPRATQGQCHTRGPVCIMMPGKHLPVGTSQSAIHVIKPSHPTVSHPTERSVTMVCTIFQRLASKSTASVLQTKQPSMHTPSSPSQ